jgi:hypothetical protein
MKIKDETRTVPLKNIDISDIPDGTVFGGKINGYDPGIFLKSYRTVVSLSDDGKIWYDRSSLEIRDYEELNAELIIRKE